jgi:TetR/AcrR family fatty acid metabolism transcriptional regulator
MFADDIDSFNNSRSRNLPPGRVKIANALRQLLESKEFDAITTAEIARTAGVNEALIYRYFGDKRGLLHQILSEYLEYYVLQVEKDLGGIQGSLARLRRLIWCHINMLSSNRVFAKLNLLEVRSFPGYFGGQCYDQVKRYASIFMEILEECVKEGVIRDDIPLRSLRQIVLGGMEHLCLPEIIFDRQFSTDQFTEDLCNVFFNGILVRRDAAPSN